MRWIWIVVLSLVGLASAAFLVLNDSQTSPDADTLLLRKLEAQAARIAAHEDLSPVLRQVDTDQTQYVFRYTDLKGKAEIDVKVPEPGAPQDRWEVQKITGLSKLLGYPVSKRINPAEIRVGPGRIASGLLNRWPGCKLSWMTLYPEQDGLAWTGFCSTPAGVVTGSVRNRTGKFTPSDAPPALPPSTATP